MNQQTNQDFAVVDGSEAAAYIAYRTNEICVIYPITPASVMGELPDQWASEGIKNIWNTVPQIVTMQSEGGAAGALHGAILTGGLATTFTASQGLLLMIPNMYRIAGELSPTVFHVAARTIATHGMSIYCDHSDVYAARSTGFAILCSANVQEAHDLALIAQVATLNSRIPFLHFFDGFRTSHEITKINLLSDEKIKAMLPDELIINNRNNRLTPNNPTAKGIVSGSDTYFQSREAVNSFYDNLPDILTKVMQQFKEISGRKHNLVEYYGDPKAKRIIVIMGSAAETVQETVDYLNKQNAEVGIIKIKLFRPFPKKCFIDILPKTCKSLAILDRSKEPGAAGEPLYAEIAITLMEAGENLKKIKIISGRFGIASKEFTPAMVQAIFNELNKITPKNHFTIGINDDVTYTSLDYDKNFNIEPDEVIRAIFYGLGSDGTVSANKNSIKIIGEETDLYAQGYFVYDAKKTGSQTISHLRFGPKPIKSAYLINSANFIGCHQFKFIEKIQILKNAAQNAIFLLNSQFDVDKVWQKLPSSLQQNIINKNIKFFIIDAYKVAQKLNMGSHINTIMQTCFFALSNILPKDIAIIKIKDAIRKTYISKGEKVLEKNYEAVDSALANLYQVNYPKEVTNDFNLLPSINQNAPKFMREVIGKMIAGEGDDLPVSAFPCDGTYPTNSTCWEKRNIAHQIPVWNEQNCIKCGLCSIACPHSAIRSSKQDGKFKINIYAKDCTGCGSCAHACPGNKKKPALVMQPNTVNNYPAVSLLENLPQNDNAMQEKIDKSNVRGIQHAEPMFEFCAACAGCGEATYIKLLTQLFGDRLLIADACGCSLVLGGHLPTVPWTVNAQGRGPAFGSSLFEDNAEFGYGFLLSTEKQHEQAKELILELKEQINNSELITDLIEAKQNTEEEINILRKQIIKLNQCLVKIENPKAKQLLSLSEQLVKPSIWTIGGDGWAYDIGYGGLDHVLASGRNIKILVLDTEVYSNTGGQASKATPRGAVGKFAASGKPTAKKDLGLMLMTYGNIYVASISLGADPNQAIRAIQEAQNYNGPAIVLAYSHCISHGIAMHTGLQQQKLAVQCGYWPLYRHNPDLVNLGQNPLQIDSSNITGSFNDYIANENRYQILSRTNPELAQDMIKLAKQDIDRKWSIYKALQNI